MCYHLVSRGGTRSEVVGIVAGNGNGWKMWRWSAISDSPTLSEIFWWRTNKLPFGSLNRLLHTHLATAIQPVMWSLILRFLVVGSPGTVSITALEPRIWASRCCTVIHVAQARRWLRSLHLLHVSASVGEWHSCSAGIIYFRVTFSVLLWVLDKWKFVKLHIVCMPFLKKSHCV